LSSVLNILKAVSARRRAHDILYVFVEQVARAVTIDRCSVVRVWGGDNVGHVLASHEDETVTDLPIDLGKYPEIRRAMETRQKVIINDTRHDPLMRPFLNELTQSGIASVVVIPVVLFDQNVGSFLLRAARTRGPFLLREISFCEIVAEAAANALERAHLFESIQRANERLEYLAVTDGLTGLYNHRYFRERLESEFDRARRYSLPLSCMIMDIDNFKKINDTYGHLQGDGILRSIAATTLQNVRKSDIVARYGGEEFVVIMPQTGIDGARAQANRVRNDVGGAAYNGMPEGRHVTVSIGVAVFDAATMFDCEALIRAADSALYRAKREGKNRVVVDQPGGNAT
jgi:two-component system cell cycle response regulator